MTARRLATLAVAGTLALSGCAGRVAAESGGGGGSDGSGGSEGSGAEAIVSDGQTWSVGDVQTATRQTNDFLRQNQQQELTPEQVSHLLAYAPDYVAFGRDVLAKDENLAGQGFTVPSEGVVQRALGETGTPTDATVQVVRAFVVGSVVQQAQLPEASQLDDAIRERDVRFSPRYSDQDPDWLEQPPVPEQPVEQVPLQ